jgi:YgiT-type zinc finger domain-containing protein
MAEQMFCGTCERKTAFEKKLVREQVEVNGKLVEAEGPAHVCTVCGTIRGDALFDGLLAQAREKTR